MEQTMKDDQQNEKFIKMTTAPIGPLIIGLAIPSAIIMLISALYNMADTFFVSFLGTSATAAVGVSFPLMAVIQAVGFFFGHGSGNYIARELGAQNYTNASKMAATGFFSAFIAGVLLAIFGVLFLEPLVRLLGATDTILPFAREYLRFILIGAPFMMCSLMQNNLLRYQGSSFYGMIGMVSGALINIALDPLFIFVFHLGSGGAGLATMISQFISFCILLIASGKKDNVRIRFKYFSPSLANYREMLRGGLPSLARQGIASISGICMNNFAGSFGDEAIAAITIVQRVFMMAASLVAGIGQGFQPVCGFNYGAKLYPRVKQGFLFSMLVMTIPLIPLGILGFIFAPQIIALFRPDDTLLIEIGARVFRYQCYTIPLLGWVTINSMMMQTMGKAFKASLLAIARQGLFMLPLLFLLTPLFGFTGIAVSQPLADFGTFILSIPLSISVFREMKHDSPGAITIKK
ncbi:MATE efflux family protein [Treponema primitia ZAS-2]|uniref:Multidrug export protein MepA n=1 Tax=Treponema primitia (strain ATCC BAA-887 / DSM 12427 / ZAS-2) TaxID=545694 RepID=F5YPQ3_TREPZ|nr:MATE family efflux transporter [Treponema primitia]AEF86746.1 MATE efflux family protein [Treponema primitia ZAS-2]